LTNIILSAAIIVCLLAFPNEHDV